MMKNKILGVVVLYNPDIEKLIDNINCYIENIDKLLLWQNSLISSENKKIILAGCNFPNKLFFIGDGTNQGLGVAFNDALKIAYDEEYVYLMTMDQDSFWEGFKEYINAIYSCENEKVAIFGPKILNVFDTPSASIIIENTLSEIDFVISSGAIYKVDVMISIGGFAEGYFIDAIDEEVCYRAKMKDFKTIKVNSAVLLQEFGDYKKRTILGRKIATSNYSAFRYYFIIRNHIWLIKSGLLDKKQKRLIFRNYIFSLTVKGLLFEEKKISKLYSIIKGVWAGIFTKPKERVS